MRKYGRNVLKVFAQDRSEISLDNRRLGPRQPFRERTQFGGCGDDGETRIAKESGQFFLVDGIGVGMKEGDSCYPTIFPTQGANWFAKSFEIERLEYASRLVESFGNLDDFSMQRFPLARAKVK
tara:strand:- start:239 stop:610 length:372 start_codon:yes stop_codon:yes gene_type:complete